MTVTGKHVLSEFLCFLDKYYRVDIRTKRVDPAVPPYPRPIAKYWLGCSDTPGAEKK